MTAIASNYSNIIRDSIHGNIPFSDLERQVIDSAVFQRLRNISQLGFLKYIFPCSNHSRFEHSIGVMHLSSRILDALLANQASLLEKTGSPAAVCPEEISATASLMSGLADPLLRQKLRLAALLHDLGHGPYSHASECLTRNIDPGTFLSKVRYPDLKEVFADRIKKGQRPGHEWFSHLLLEELLREIPEAGAEFSADIHAILDPDFSALAGPALRDNSLYILLHDIISSEMDGDRMDYLLRDSHSAGVNYGVYDLERLLANLCIYISADGPRIALNHSGLQSFEDYLIGRYQMYLQIYTHKTNSAMESMLEKVGREISFDHPFDTEGFLDFNESSFFNRLTASPVSDKERSAGVREICDCILNKRKPWKPVFLGSATRLSGEEDRYKQYLDILAGSPFTDDYVTFETSRSLTSLKPMFSRGSRSLKILKKDVLGSSWSLSDIFDHSYILSAFKQEIFLSRIYVRPDKKEEISKYIKEKV